MNILVTGKNGQLGSEIKELSVNYKHHFVFTGSEECNIANRDELENVIKSNNIDAIINCAAYTAVDQAEEDIDTATNVNRDGVHNINAIAEKYGLRYIHISTDYVFNGQNEIPYKTNDPVDPLGVYGTTKRQGEEIVINSNTDAIVIRTSWVYSFYGKNFVKTMLRLGSERSELNVVNDQVGCPTYARDLAKVCLEIIQIETISKHQRIYHYSNSGVISWYQFALKIMELAGLDCTIHPITSDQFPTKAERPKYSVLDTSEIKRDFNVDIPEWETSLRHCLDRLIESEF